MHASKIFRTAALKVQQISYQGDIVLIRPVSFNLLASIAAVFAIVVFIFLLFGTYTQRINVSGQLVLDTGLVKVYTPQSGIVLHKYVTEGEYVKQGAPLFMISSEQQSSTQGNTQAAISRLMESRRAFLINEIVNTKSLHGNDRKALMEKIRGLQSEQVIINDQIDEQKKRIALAQENLIRYKSLFMLGYISKEQFEEKQTNLLDQMSQLRGLERDKINTKLDLDARQSELVSLPMKQQNNISQIKLALATTEQELSENAAKRRLIILAPQTGVITTVNAELGQAVAVSKPLVGIIPENAILQARLYVPSKAIGFIKPGNTVLLRFQAYPYQKFGHAKGIVKYISKAAFPANELTNIINMATNTAITNNESVYIITVDLAKQNMIAYGKPQALQAGMLLDADILQETRKLYEWVLSPLYSLTGKF
ncbi:MAG: HlyD family secretion protein [Burkholderiales bacterium]